MKQRDYRVLIHIQDTQILQFVEMDKGTPHTPTKLLMIQATQKFKKKLTLYPVTFDLLVSIVLENLYLLLLLHCAPIWYLL